MPKGVYVHRRLSVETKILRKTVQVGECWLFTGFLDRDGYGVTTDDRSRTRRAHRVLWQAVMGVIPDGLHLDHLCRVRNCVNLGHLEVVTPKENAHRGVSAIPMQRHKTHCIRGHELVTGNIYPNRRDGRVCMQCAKERNRRYYLSRVSQR